MGVPGVVAMRYNVYVVTAAQFVADLYAHLLVGKSSRPGRGRCAAGAGGGPGAAGRQLLPLSLQDWAVPVIYESAPLVLLRHPEPGVPHRWSSSPRPTPRPDGDGAATGGGAASRLMRGF